MKLKNAVILILTLLMILFLIIIIPSVGAYDCKPPVDFSIEHDCTLFDGQIGTGINEFQCGNYKIVGDCDGGVVSYKERTGLIIVQSNTLKLVFIGFIVLLIIVGLFIAFSTLREEEYD